MKIAILGWGSLVWDQRDLPLNGAWEQGGPTLPIEFSRISGRTASKPGNRLTLVIDEECGTRVPTRFALSANGDVASARESLRKREGANASGIAAIDLRADARFATKSQAITDLVSQWVKTSGFDGAVWTALPPNFADALAKPYSWDAAFAFLDALGGDDRQAAFDYIRKAPEEVRTPFRSEFQKRYPL